MFVLFHRIRMIFFDGSKKNVFSGQQKTFRSVSERFWVCVAGCGNGEVLRGQKAMKAGKQSIWVCCLENGGLWATKKPFGVAERFFVGVDFLCRVIFFCGRR